GQGRSGETPGRGEDRIDAPPEGGTHSGERGAHALAGLGAGEIRVRLVRELGLTLTLPSPLEGAGGGEGGVLDSGWPQQLIEALVAEELSAQDGLVGGILQPEPE